MSSGIDIYIASVALEPTRWGRKEASFAVSEWLPRFEADGFEGVELWDRHFLSVEESERQRLVSASDAIPIYSSYIGFNDADAGARAQAADAVTRLGSTGVKYNLGGDVSKLDEYRRNLMQWETQLPSTCRLLCECHPGTVLETLPEAVAFFDDLDPERFGVIAHLACEPEGPEAFFDAFGSRIKHLHVQMRGPASDPSKADNRQVLDACFSVPAAHGFDGTLSVEFTRGIGRDEDIEVIYENACTDMHYIRGVMS